jgi:hypothetical protein
VVLVDGALVLYLERGGRRSSSSPTTRTTCARRRPTSRRPPVPTAGDPHGREGERRRAVQARGRRTGDRRPAQPAAAGGRLRRHRAVSPCTQGAVTAPGRAYPGA